MKRVKSLWLATWMVEHLTFGLKNEALVGDLLEELQLGRSAAWLWRQVLIAIAIRASKITREAAVPALFAAAWSMFYPMWMWAARDLSSPALSRSWATLSWPGSALLEIGFGVIPAIMFIWAGFLVYLLSRTELLRELHPLRIVHGLSISLTVLLSVTMGMLNHLRHGHIDLICLTRADFYSRFHYFNVCIPLAMSLLAALLLTLSQTPGLRRRLHSRRQSSWRIASVFRVLCLALSVPVHSAAQAPPPPNASPSPGTDTELITAIRKRLEDLIAADRFSGDVLIAKDGKPIFEQAYGLADRERHIPNTLRTRFRIGSMNKMFTAVAILQLAQAHKLSLDEPIGKYLTDYPNKELADKVTISELLDHTGGTGDTFDATPGHPFGPAYLTHRLELHTLQDYITLYGDRPLRFEPGSRFEYSGYGYILLGRVIEKISGESYYDYVQKHVYKPAGMTSTGSGPEGTIADLSVGYTRFGRGEWHPDTDLLPYRGDSSGGGYSTVGDLLAFANALRDNKLLNAYYTELLMTGKVDMPRDGRYAYGFIVHPLNGSQCVGHAGDFPGANGDLEMCLDSRYAFAVLANMDPPVAQQTGFFIGNWLTLSHQTR
jgi:D-alanyl-D-alanine carboxypeptidase